MLLLSSQLRAATNRAVGLPSYVKFLKDYTRLNKAIELENSCI